MQNTKKETEQEYRERISKIIADVDLSKEVKKVLKGKKKKQGTKQPD